MHPALKYHIEGETRYATGGQLALRVPDGESVTYMAITGEMPEPGASFRERSLAAC
jgi:hypothetical protein